MVCTRIAVAEPPGRHHNGTSGYGSEDQKGVSGMNQPGSEATVDGTGDRGPLSEDELRSMDAYWRAANYLSVGQIYLLDNPLLREPLAPEHVKPRLLGHWGTTPGLNFVYVHMNRVIRNWDLNAIYVTGPGHGGPGLVANAYLERTYSEVYPDITRDEDGMRKLFRHPATSPPRPPDRSTRVGSSATPWPTRTARRSTTRTCWCAVWSGTERPRPAPSPPAGIRTSSWTRPQTVPCSPSCT